MKEGLKSVCHGREMCFHFVVAAVYCHVVSVVNGIDADNAASYVSALVFFKHRFGVAGRTRFGLRMKVFLSHTSADKAAVRAIMDALIPFGPSYWLDEKELLPGDSLYGAIEKGASASDCVLVLISPRSLKSNWVEREVRAFLAREESGDRPLVIPVIIDDCSPSAVPNRSNSRAFQLRHT